MNKFSCIFIITVVILCNCSPKRASTKSSQLSQKQVRDSITSILISVSDDWTFVSSETTSGNKILMPEIEKVEIRHWAKINSKEPLNELSITGLTLKYVDSTNTMVGWTYDYEANVEYRRDQFGLNITNDSVSGFIGIKKINGTSLLFAYGQHFERIK